MYGRARQGKSSDDVFVEMAKFVKIEKEMREALKNYGFSLKEYRVGYIEIEEKLFD